MNYEIIKKVKSMNTKTIVTVAIILAMLGAGYALARPGSGDFWGSMMGGNWNGNGMMNNFGNGIWNGMMGGHWGMMGYGNGNNHCGAGGGYAGSGYRANATP